MRFNPAKFALWTSGLTFAGISSASELAAGVSIEPATGHWPWIAVAAIAGLLGVVSFVSRRRMHSVVGS